MFDEDINGWKSLGGSFGFETYVRPFVKPVASTIFAPKFSVFLKSKVKIPSALEKSAIKKVAKSMASGKTLVCTGYTYGTSSAARAYSLKLAKAVCAIAKASSPRITVVSETKPSSKATKAARGSVWLPGSYRVDLSIRNSAD